MLEGGYHLNNDHLIFSIPIISNAILLDPLVGIKYNNSNFEPISYSNELFVNSVYPYDIENIKLNLPIARLKSIGYTVEKISNSYANLMNKLNTKISSDQLLFFYKIIKNHAAYKNIFDKLDWINSRYDRENNVYLIKYYLSNSKQSKSGYLIINSEYNVIENIILDSSSELVIINDKYIIKYKDKDNIKLNYLVYNGVRYEY